MKQCDESALMSEHCNHSAPMNFRQGCPFFGGQPLNTEVAWHTVAPDAEEFRCRSQEAAMRGRGLHGVPLAAFDVRVFLLPLLLLLLVPLLLLAGLCGGITHVPPFQSVMRDQPSR